jgi:hypothetical protein
VHPSFKRHCHIASSTKESRRLRFRSIYRDYSSRLAAIAILDYSLDPSSLPHFSTLNDIRMSQSLLFDVLRPTTAQVDQIAAKLSKLNVPDDGPSSTRVPNSADFQGGGTIDSSDDDELIGVVRLRMFAAHIIPFGAFR